MTETILAARNLTYHYPDGTPALTDLNLTIPRHGRLAVLGANGAGKTTLLLHLAGALRPHRGEVLLEGRPLTYDRQGLNRWREQVGMVLQDPDDQLFAASVEQDVSFGPLNLGLPPAAVAERLAQALAALEIEHLRDRPTHMLSHGQRKRVAIAGALAMGPRVLILDEPTAGLDPRGTEQLLAVLDRLHRAGTTLVLATHDMDPAYGWASRVAVLHQGSVAREGAPEAVLQEATLLAAAGLRLPWVLEVGLRLQALGCLGGGLGGPGGPGRPAGGPPGGLPRTRTEILEALGRVKR